MSNALAVQQDNKITFSEKPKIEQSILEEVLINGNIANLSPNERLTYYSKVCESLGLNPLTKPFDYIQLNGKLQLYARKDATEQLRKLNKISITKLETKLFDDGLYVVTASGTTQDGREDVATGVVNIKTLQGDNRANAMMKAETKAKRRLTLSLAGLGMLDETEIETIPTYQRSSNQEIKVEVVHSDKFEAIVKEFISTLESCKNIEELQETYNKVIKEMKLKLPLSVYNVEINKIITTKNQLKEGFSFFDQTTEEK